MRFALVTALLMKGILVGPALAQEWKGHARVDGRVLGEGAAPVAGATIDARHVSGPGGPRVTSDAEGRFIVDGIASGSWVLEVVVPGYRVRRLDVHLSRDSSWLGPVEVQLEREAPPPEGPDEPVATSGDETASLPPEGGDESAVGGDGGTVGEPEVPAHDPEGPVGEDDGPVGYEDVRAALEKGRVDQAKQLTAAMEKGGGGDPALLFEIGVGFLNAGETREAVGFFDRVLEEDPAHVPARYRRALGLLALGRHDEAREDLEAVLERQPNGELAAKAVLALDQLKPSPAEEQ
jgi:hypothetical protein